MAVMRVIVDANIVIGWFFKTGLPIDAISLAVYEEAEQGRIQLIAPEVLAYEAAYVMLKRGRTLKTPSVKISEMCEYIDMYVTKIKPAPSMTTAAGISRFAYQHNVQGYDAQYLALAIDSKAPIATNDRGLASACRRSGVASATVLRGRRI